MNIQHADRGTSYAVSVGHNRAAEIAADVLDAGGNAVDAGVAASIALTVLHSEQVQLGGVSPILVYLAESQQTYSIEGAGSWPHAVERTHFEEKYRGRIPQGILRTVTPAGPDAWITALEQFGSMSFFELAEPARNLAKEGFPAHQDLVDCTKQFERYYRRYEENTNIWLPNGQPVQLGQTFIQPSLANTLGAMIETDRKAASKKDRIAGLSAVRDIFYKGEIADEMIRHIVKHDGLMTHTDLALHKTPVVPATASPVFGGTAFTCGFWSQGPVLSQSLQILEHFYRENPSEINCSRHHVFLEAIKLAMADREAYYGDPNFVNVPSDHLLSPAYAAERANQIQTDHAFDALPSAGSFSGLEKPKISANRRSTEFSPSLDTSIAVVADKHGNIFASTPSDSSFDGPAVPNLGFVISTRGGQSYVTNDHPACLYPGKRPRVSACPFIIRNREGRFIAGGGPGADLQLQTAVQILMNHFIFDQPLADAVSEPRVFTHSAPGSSEPHLSFAGKIVIEEGIPEPVAVNLEKIGHKITRETSHGINRPSVCIVGSGEGHYEAIGDPRRDSGQKTKINSQQKIS
ncbi:gamma-glutamyltransferase family protein [Sneathiella marina]|uniref:Gamma-glutamyltransferase family protein n=1 Tax=Sneathiella marina TaxID=2950108 RepID=A0ABY4WBF0_9PROT|nr:gamma-glutamyltransferase [Sneathiella marina]USG61991.1 gamma-glutamyltransferase family protein [Sneathiella marina]